MFNKPTLEEQHFYGEYKKPFYKEYWFWIIAIILIIFIQNISLRKEVGSLGYKVYLLEKKTATLSQSTTNENTQTDNVLNQNFIGEGMYKVGVDIPAGEYKLIPEDGSPYYLIKPDSTGMSRIIDNGFINYERYITVTNGQYLEIRDSHMIKIN